MDVTVFWIGTTSKSVPTIGVKYFSKGFACKKFVEVESIEGFVVNSIITLPKEALN
jgi:hypothetical protein